MMAHRILSRNAFSRVAASSWVCASIFGLGAPAALASSQLSPAFMALSARAQQVGSLHLVDHTPNCPPGSHHPGGAADRAAKRLLEKQRAQSKAVVIPYKAITKEPVAEKDKTKPQVPAQQQQPTPQQDDTTQQATTQDPATPQLQKPLATVPAANGKVWDYSYLRSDINENFKPGYAYVSETLKEDLFAVQFFDSNKKLGRGEGNRTFASWIPSNGHILSVDGEISVRALDDVLRKALSFRPSWGDRDRMAIVRIPKGTVVELVKGEAIDQSTYPGLGTQLLFMKFSEEWIVRIVTVPKGPFASLSSGN